MTQGLGRQQQGGKKQHVVTERVTFKEDDLVGGGERGKGRSRNEDKV